MKDLTNHIEYLLQCHDCVILPGIGAILAHSVSAHYNDEVGSWLPPHRALSFNSELTRTDGLLAASVARRRKISIAAATQIVASATDRMRNILDSNSPLDLGLAGRLERNADGKILYFPPKTSLISPQFMWLAATSTPKICNDNHNSDYDENVVYINHTKLWRRALRVAASFAIIVLIGWAVKVNLSEASMQQFASLWPMTTNDQVNEEPAVEGDATASMTLILPAQPQEEEDASAPLLNEKFCVIVGSFANEAEAQKFINSKNNQNLGILSADGRCRVYAASAPTEAEAYAIATSASFVDKYPSAWVCRR